MPLRKNSSTSIKYRRFRKKYNSILCGAGKKLNFARRVWCEQYEPKKSTLHMSRDESPISTVCCISYFISLRVWKCGLTHASRAEIRIFTPRDIKFRTILVRKTFSWRVWLHLTSLRLVLQTHTRQKTFHRTRSVMYYFTTQMCHFVSVNGEASRVRQESRPKNKNFEKKILGKKIRKKSFEKKVLGKKIRKKSFEKKVLGKKCWKKNFEKKNLENKFWINKLQNKNIHNQSL